MPKRDAAFSLLLISAPLVMGLVLGFLTLQARLDPGSMGTGALVLFAVGFLMFFIAKLSLLRRGIRFSFGSAHMSRLNRLAYRLGYVLMLTGFLATLGVVSASQLPASH